MGELHFVFFLLFCKGSSGCNHFFDNGSVSSVSINAQHYHYGYRLGSYRNDNEERSGTVWIEPVLRNDFDTLTKIVIVVPFY